MNVNIFFLFKPFFHVHTWSNPLRLRNSNGVKVEAKWRCRKEQKNSETKYIDFVGLNAQWTFKMHSHLNLRQPSSGWCFSSIVHRLPTIESPGEIPKNAKPWVLFNAYWVRITTGAGKAPAFSASILKRSRHINWSYLSCGFEYCLHAGRKETGYLYPELYHDPKNWHLYLGTSQVSWVSKDKSELVIILILVNDNSIHPDAYPRNVGIILDTLFSSLMTSYFWPWSIDHTCSTSLKVRVHCSNNSKILVVEDCKESTRALPDSAGLILKMQVKFRSMACISSFQTRVMEHHHHH